MILTVLLAVPAAVGLGLLAVRADRLRQTLLLLAAGLHLALTGSLWDVDLPLETWGGYLRLDAVGLLFLSLVSLLFAVCTLYGLAYLPRVRQRGALPQRVYDGGLLLFLAAMTLVVTSNHV